MKTLHWAIITSFSCSFQEKIDQKAGWRPLPRGWRPPWENPGSATEKNMKDHVFMLIKYYFLTRRISLSDS